MYMTTNPLKATWYGKYQVRLLGYVFAHDEILKIYKISSKNRKASAGGVMS